MRVLINGLLAGNRSGTGRYIIELTRALLKLREENEFYFLWPSDFAVPDAMEKDYFIPVFSSPISRFMSEQSGLLMHSRKVCAELLHYPASIGPVIARLPVTLTVHDLCYFSHPEWFSFSRSMYYRCFMGPGIRRADRIIADSQATADDIIHYMKISEDRVHVVHLGVDSCFAPAEPSEYRRIREQHRLPEEFFLFVGTLEPRKNLSRIIAAWSKIADSAPDLVIAGRVGWKVSSNALASCPSNLAGRIHCIGHVAQPDLAALYSAATALIWPSLMEGFGLPPLEAMACGVPVLTSNQSSLPEVVGQAALLVNPFSVDAIAEGMEALHCDPALRQRLRKAGIEQAARFTWEAAALKTIQVYIG